MVEIEDGDTGPGGLENVLLSIFTSGDDWRRQTRLFGDVAEIDGDGRQVGFNDGRGTRDPVAAPHSLETLDATPSEQRNHRNHDGELPHGQ